MEAEIKEENFPMEMKLVINDAYELVNILSALEDYGCTFKPDKS